MSSKPERVATHEHAFRAALSKVTAASRRLRRRREMRVRRAWLPVQTQPAHPDPVKIAVLAMESPGLASIRASVTRVEVKVAVPDDATAAIFRAALSETTRTRPTDRLVRVVVD
jgi:hypothetical protein